MLSLKTLPNTDEVASNNAVLNIFDKMFSNNGQLDGNDDYNNKLEKSGSIIESCNNYEIGLISSNSSIKSDADAVTPNKAISRQLVELSSNTVIADKPTNNAGCILAQLDGNVSNDGSGEDEDLLVDCMLTQLDGHLSLSGTSGGEENKKKKIFSVNCEIEEIIEVITFFRSYNFIWKALTCHQLCTTDCFFCNMRSTCLRLNAQRGRGPKSLKIMEFIFPVR